MKRQWDILSKQSDIPIADDLGMPGDVLVEYDGPQLVICGSENGTRIGILGDVGVGCERWIVAGVGSLELVALALGNLPMRDVFSRKPVLRVVDFDGSWKPLRAWSIKSLSVPTGILPVSGAPLPMASQQFLRKKFKVKEAAKPQQRIRFSGLHVHDSFIEVAAFSALVQVAQNFITSIGESLGLHFLGAGDALPNTTLMLGATSIGSFAVDVHPTNNAVFEKVLKRYQVLINLAYSDRVKLQREIGDDNRLQRSMYEYFRVLNSYDAEILVETPKKRIYVGSAGASLISSTLRPNAKASVTVKFTKSSKAEPSEHRGYFAEFGLPKSTFEFYDIDKRKSIKGKVSANLVKQMAEQGKKDASVGRIVRYRVTIETDETNSTLTSVTRLGQEDFGFD